MVSGEVRGSPMFCNHCRNRTGIRGRYQRHVARGTRRWTAFAFYKITVVQSSLNIKHSMSRPFGSVYASLTDLNV